MKPIAHQFSAAAVLILGLVVFFGAPAVAARTGYAEPTYDMLVVQSSVGRKLTPADLDQLHDAVARFLVSQGPVHRGEYVVRIDFPPTRPGAAAEWIIVKLTNLPPPAFSLAGNNAADESDYGSGYDPGYSYSPYGFYDPFNPYFGEYYWPQAGVSFGGNRHWRIDRDNHDRDGRAGRNSRSDYRDHAGERKPVDMGKRPRMTYTRIDNQSGAQRPGGRDDSTSSQRPRNGAQDGNEHRIQAADNMPRPANGGRWRDTGSVDRPPQLSGERPGRSSFVPPPARTPPPPPLSNSQKDRDAGNRRPEP